MNPWIVILTADDGTATAVGPFGARHRADNFADSVDGEATAVMLETPASVRAELTERGLWAPPNGAARRARGGNSFTRGQDQLAAKRADPNRLDWSEAR